MSHTWNRVDNLFPRLYPILPAAVAADVVLTRENSPVERKFMADLTIFYAFDLGNQFAMLNYRRLEELGITDEELHVQSLKNLRKLNLEVKAHRGAQFTMLSAGGNFEATLLLLPEVWESVAAMVQGDLVAAVPARDVLLFAGAASEADLAALRAATSKVLENADKPLSRNFLRRSAEGWRPYEGFAS